MTNGRGTAPQPTPRVEIHAPATAMVENAASFGHDVLTLAELQAKLAAVDLKEAAGHAAIPFAVIAVGATLALGSIPVALMGLAEMLDGATHLGPGASRLITAAGALVIGVIALAIAASRLGAAFRSLERTREELSRNLAWIKTVIVYSGRSSVRR